MTRSTSAPVAGPPPPPDDETEILVTKDGMITETLPWNRRIRRWLASHKTMIRNGVIGFIGFAILVAYFYFAWAVLVLTFAAMSGTMWAFFGVSVLAAAYMFYFVLRYMENIKARFARVTA